MSLFHREPQASHPAPAPAPSSSPRHRQTLVAAGSKVSGEISGTSELLVEGTVEGDVRIEAAVTVGAAGTVTGSIVARSVSIRGKVVGDVQGSERVEVGAAGSLEGNVSAPRVVIAEGAFFRGKVQMQGQSKTDPASAERENRTKPRT